LSENDLTKTGPVDAPAARTGEIPLSPPSLAGPRPLTNAGWGWLLALLAFSLLIAFYRLDGGAGLEPVEAWVAQPAREIYENISNMLANRLEKGWDWRPIVIPEFCGETRLQKSPGAYWTVCLVSYLRSGVVDEVSIRIPNAIAAVIMVLTIFWLTRRIAGERAAIFAGFAAASSTMFLSWSHSGASDMGTAALISLSLACLWVASEDEPPGWKRNLLWLAGYFCAGLAMIYKFPLPAPCVGLPAILYVLLRNRWKIFASWWHVLGLILFLLPWLPWALAAMHFEDSAIHKWRVEYLDRVTGDLPNVEDQKAFYWQLFYVGTALLLSLPFTLSIPAALARPFRKAEQVRRNGVWFVYIWFVSLLAFFTFAAGKETRYFLPAMPPLFALLGGELAAFFDPQRHSSRALDKLGLVAVCMLVPAALVGTGFLLHGFWQDHASQGMFTWPQVWRPYAVAAAVLGVGFIFGAILYFRRRENFAFGILAGTMWLAWLWVWPQLMPILASQAPFKDFARQLKSLSPEQKTALRQVAQQDPRYIWYSDVRFPRLIDQLVLLDEQGGRRDVAHEIERYQEESLRVLAGNPLVLLVASADHYGLFLTKLRDRWEAQGRSYPKTYVWFQAQAGRADRRYLVFGNQPPPWPTPAVVLPKEWQDELDKRMARPAASAPAEPAPATQSAPTTQSSSTD
jgi:4-amino-4-deoxy-L-arabinose transferase-like glycosyltransferase